MNCSRYYFLRVFTTSINGGSYAIIYEFIGLGKTLQLDGQSLFLFRCQVDELHDSTKAF